MEKGDLFIVRGNGSLDMVGRAGLVEDEPTRVAFPDTLIRARVAPDRANVRYLRAIWNSPIVRDQIERRARTSAGIYKINQQDLLSIVVPVPLELDNQRHVAGEIERRSSIRQALGDVVGKRVRSERPLTNRRRTNKLKLN